SKSLGNIITVRELFEQGWKGETIRLALLSAHYRQPLDFSDAALEQAETALNRWYAALRNVPGNMPRGEADEGVRAALEDDLNTPAAIAAIHEIVTELNKSTTDERRQALKGRLLDSGRQLGVLASSPDAWFDIQDDLRTSWVEHRLRQRAEARRAKDFATADSIRKELVDAGVLLEDKPDGTTLWRMR
ncbi:MAG: DALR domain-containing protein, partial [Rhodospirillaceae bacterium]